MDFMFDDEFESQVDPDHGIEVLEYPEKCPDFYEQGEADEAALGEMVAAIDKCDDFVEWATPKRDAAR